MKPSRQLNQPFSMWNENFFLKRSSFSRQQYLTTNGTDNISYLLVSATTSSGFIFKILVNRLPCIAWVALELGNVHGTGCRIQFVLMHLNSLPRDQLIHPTTRQPHTHTPKSIISKYFQRETTLMSSLSATTITGRCAQKSDKPIQLPLLKKSINFNV